MLHHLTGLFGATILDPGQNETETMIQALRIELGLLLRDADFRQLADQRRAGPGVAQQSHCAR